MPKLIDRKDDQLITFVRNGLCITVDTEDYERVKVPGWNLSTNKSTIAATINKKRWTIGRFILDYSGPLTVDHKDRNICNNSKSNLRLCTLQQQQMNRGPIKGKRFKGVYKHKYGWQTYLDKNNYHHNGGIHSTEEGAARAYDKLAAKYFKEYAYLNFPGEINAQVD